MRLSRFGSLGRVRFIILISTMGLIQSTLTAQEVNFRDEIQPLLAKNCYFCHGPDANHREADLRLDQEEPAKEYAIVPGDSAASELISRIFSDDPEVIMPPPDSERSLSQDEKDLLKRWIDQGANWQRHWAFEPIQSPTPPPVASDWARNEIDHFVWQRMQDAGLKPAQPTDRRTLLRRVYLDLIGIPPTYEQVQAFVADQNPRAFETIVDQLLDSPHFGEQMAVSWLDVARFADTNGYQNDFLRSMWPWRDWVINAFNQNMPFDQFVLEQIAGDMLLDPTPSQLVATGFNRNNHSVTEGGSIDEEWRIENGVDRVETTSATFLGLTMGCCRCHDHKYDPISQKEFYQFFAFFNNVDEKGVYEEVRGNTEPLLRVPTPDQVQRLAELKNQIESLDEQLASLQANDSITTDALDQWREQVVELGDTNLAKPVYSFPGDCELPKNLARGISPVASSVVLPGKSEAVGAIAQPDFEFEFDRPFSWSAWVKGDARGSIFGKMDEANSYRGLDAIILGDGRVKIHLIHQWTSNAIAVISKKTLPNVQWANITVTYDGKLAAKGLKIYFDGQLTASETEFDSLTDVIANEVPFKIGQRNSSEFLDGELSEFRIYDQELSADQVLAILQAEVIEYFDTIRSETTEVNDPKRTVIKRYVANQTPSPLVEKSAALKAESDRLVAEQQTTMIMRERPEYRKTYLLRRGQYDQPDESAVLWPAIPAVLPQLSDDQPANRLGLARWLIDPRNPLVARVAVNRAWMKFFSRGIVESVDNFGLQGTPPTHPLLLDWLANDFRNHGWDLKRLHKQIVMSATYQQDSTLTPEKLERDPENRWFARGPRYRLSGEQIRDQALVVSDLIVEKIGGPSVMPYQPEGLWEELAGGANNGPYHQSTGDDIYRRSLYTYRKRTVSHPTLATFDAPSWEICQIKRARTNTPLQSLALLNDITYVEAARNLAQRMLRETTDSKQATNESIRFGFRLALLRDPTEQELQTLNAGWSEYLNYYRDHPEEAKQLIETGDSQYDQALPADRLAAMTSVASILLNLDEVITKE